jgi:hypothetical protein
LLVANEKIVFKKKRARLSLTRAIFEIKKRNNELIISNKKLLFKMKKSTQLK